MKDHATFGAAGIEKIGNQLIRKQNHEDTSENIARKTEVFLAKGGKVEYVEQGKSGIVRPVKFL